MPTSRTEWWSLAIHGKVVGSEIRMFGAGTTVTRRRTFHWLVDGDEVVSRSSTAVSCDGGTCRWTSWEPGTTVSGTSDGVVPDVWPPTRSGTMRVLDPGAGEGTMSTVERVDDQVRWTTPGGPATVWFVDERPVRARVAGFEAIRVDGPIDVEPVDVARLLAIPVAPMPNARRSLVGVFVVDGREVRVDTPSWMELPAERDAVRALVLEVADGIVDSVVPGSSTGAEAWRSGRGDCTEHALALVERAQLAGFEARTAAGRVYVDGADGPALVLHAWAEIRLGERWVPADAALRQFPADASHLRLGSWVSDLGTFDGVPIDVRSLR